MVHGAFLGKRKTKTNQTQLPIQVLVRLRLQLRRNGIKCMKKFEGMQSDSKACWKKMVAHIESIYCFGVYLIFVIYFLKLKLILFYNNIIVLDHS